MKCPSGIPYWLGKTSSHPPSRNTEVSALVMIVPLWPTHTWSPSLLQMLFHQKRVLLAKPSLLQHLVTQEAHPLHRALHPLVCPVSGMPSQVSTFQQKLPISLCNLGTRVLRNNMRHTLENCWTFVIKGKLLTIHCQ